MASVGTDEPAFQNVFKHVDCGEYAAHRREIAPYVALAGQETSGSCADLKTRVERSSVPLYAAFDGSAHLDYGGRITRLLRGSLRLDVVTATTYAYF